MKDILHSLPKKILILIVVISGIQNINAQYADGTNATKEYYDMLKNNLKEETAKEFDSSAISSTTTLIIHVHVVNNVEGDDGGFTEQMVSGFLDDVNFYFRPIGIKFQIGSFDTVMEYVCGTVIDEEEDIELFTKHSIEKCINLFLVDTILISGTNYYGLTYFPDDTTHNTIFLDKDYVFEKPLITQLGHFFGLLSTYDAGLGQERVDGNNCKVAGDLICDTYADPGILGQVNNECEFTGRIKDPMGEYYVPSVSNFMTNGPFDCRCIFSPEQYRRMHFYYKKYRSYLR